MLHRRVLGFSTILQLAWLIAAGNVAIAAPVPTVTSLGLENPASAIYIGNSFFYYNNSLHNHVSRLRASDGSSKFSGVSVTISGSGINWHDVDSYFRPDAIGSYSFDANNNIVFNNRAKLFDVAIIMDCSQCPIHPKLKSIFHEYAKKDSDIVRKHGTIPVFFMSWAYQDRPEMTAELAEAYTTEANANHALVVPAGLAFARAHEQRPALVLHAEDKRHPSLAGTYLAASTVYASLFGKSPIGLKYTAGLPTEEATFLQTVAWETVQAYYGK